MHVLRRSACGECAAALKDVCCRYNPPDVALLATRPRGAQLAFCLLQARLCRGVRRGFLVVHQQHGERPAVGQPSVRAQCVVQHPNRAAQAGQYHHRHLRATVTASTGWSAQLRGMRPCQSRHSPSSLVRRQHRSTAHSHMVIACHLLRGARVMPDHEAGQLHRTAHPLLRCCCCCCCCRCSCCHHLHRHNSRAMRRLLLSLRRTVPSALPCPCKSRLISQPP